MHLLLEWLSPQLPPDTLPADHYAQQLVARMKDTQDNFCNIMSDLHRCQHKIYDSASQDLHIPNGKLVYVRKDCLPFGPNIIPRFICNYDGPYLVICHLYTRSDLLHLHKVDTGEKLPCAVNIDKVVVVPEFTSVDLHPQEDIFVMPDTDPTAEEGHVNPTLELVSVALKFRKYLETLLC